MTNQTRTEPLDRLADAIAGERHDWHRVEVAPDDIASLIAEAREAARLRTAITDIHVPDDDKRLGAAYCVVCGTLWPCETAALVKP